jgi:hypothetical protein
MNHDVFISYAVEDREVAEKVCGALEEQSIKCWMAPRDIPYGMDYEEAIVDAIGVSPLLVLVLSAHSNRSPYVKREIQTACAEGSPTQVLPFRIEDIPYSKTLRFYLGSTQWLDASAPPLESHLDRLVKHVRAHLKRGDEQPHGTVGPGSREPPVSVSEGRADAGTVVSGTGDGREFKSTGDGRTFQGTGDGRKPLPVMWIALGAGALLLVAVIAVVAYKATAGGGDDATLRESVVKAAEEYVNSNPTPPGAATPAPTPAAQQTPSSTPSATPSSNPTPTPARATPTPAASPRPVPPRNFNIRLPTNSVLGQTNSAPEEVPDSMIEAQIEKRMATHDQLSGVDVVVVGGVVSLNGTVPDADWKSTAQMLAKIKGVKAVRNNLKHN